MLAALAKLRTVASWQALARLIGLAEPDDYRNRARRPPGEWPLRRPALVGHWRRKIGGGVECYWDVADRSATVLPFKPAPMPTREASLNNDD
ncbi:MAG: hypothetical protein WCA55_22425 [Xanthobacteraceae bacterium]|jgi:hypothetical protein